MLAHFKDFAMIVVFVLLYLYVLFLYMSVVLFFYMDLESEINFKQTLHKSKCDNYKWVKMTKIQIHDGVTKTMHK